MKTITTTAIAALMTATIGLSAIAPATAQDAAPAQAQTQDGPRLHLRHHNQGGPHHMVRMGGGLLSFARGAEAVEVALVRLSHRIELTAEQQPLFDTLKADALAAAETFEAATDGLRLAPSAERPEFSEMLENRIALETAHLAALEAIQPAATAFFDSLTEKQQAQLTPQRPERDGMRGIFRKNGPHHMSPGPADAPQAPEAPTNG